ncbi:MAG TPA: rod shape-determining protein MreC [Candidatus Saccharimonadales bacterium]|nr:rod shape-determining protein MreC [Candidatus Saccharimonadales bacterium]
MLRRLRQRSTYYIALILLILIAQFPLFHPVRDRARRLVAGPVALLNHSGSQLHTAIVLFGSINALSRENAALKAQNNQLQATVAGLQTIQNENSQLRKDLNFAQSRPDLKLLPAAIINYSPVGLYQAITIDKGSHDGLKVNEVVVSSGYVIGKVKQVSNSTSEIWLLANRNLLTPVLLTGSQTTGLLQGDIGGLVVTNIPIDARVTVGEPVVTSALGNLYPAGIAVGTVEQILSHKEDIFQSARVASPVNINSLTTVFVVQTN